MLENGSLVVQQRDEAKWTLATVLSRGEMMKDG
jgi:hypothetical protein